MANKVIEVLYSLKDAISTKLSAIGDALRGHQKVSDDTTAKVQSNNQRLSESYAKAADAIKEAGQRADDAGSVFGSFKNKLAEIVSIAAAVELALKGIEFGSESLKGAEQVEASLSRVQALAQGAAGQFEALDQAVEAAAIAVNTTTENASGGLAALVSQGLNADDAMKALIPTLQLAKIANVDVGTAAQDVASALKAFNVPASDAAGIVDQLTAASHGAAGGLGAMSSAAAALAPDAKALGLSFSDIISVLGLLSSKGLDTEKAVRGLRTVFQELQDPTSKLRGDLLALGDGTNDFSKAITALNSGTPRAQQALLGLAGPARSLVETLGQAGPDAIAKFNAGLQASQGVAEKTANALDDNLLGAANRFSNSIALIGEKLAQPVLKPFTEELTKLAGELNTFAESPDFDDIRTKIGEMATKAAKSLDEFINNTNWKKFGDDGLAAVSGIGKALDELAKSASTVASLVGKTAATIGVAYHGIGVAIDGAVSSGAKLGDTFVTIAEKTTALGAGADKAAKAYENLHAGFQVVSDDADAKAGENFTALKDDLTGLAGSATEAADGIKKQGDASTAAAPAVEEHAAATQAASDALTAIIDPLQVVPGYLKGTGDAASGAAPGIESLRNEVQLIGGGPLQDAKKALADAARGFADLQGSADATPEALQAASDAVLKASRDLDKLGKSGDDSAEALKTAFHNLGVVSQESLKQSIVDAQNFFNDIKAGSDQSTAGLTDVANAFLASAQKQLAAASQLDSATQETTKSSLESQAAALGLSDQLLKLENQADKTSTALTNIGRVSPDTSGLDHVKSAANSADVALKGTGESTKSLTDRINDIGTGGFPDLSQALANTRASLLGVSDAAAKLFDAKFYGDFQTAFDATGIGFAKVIGAMSAASAEVAQQITDQRTQLQAEIENINQIGTASGTGFGQFGDNIDAAAAKMKSLSSDIATGNYDAGLLGDQELKPLQDALDAAADRVRSMQDAFNAMTQSAADAFDEAAGNQDALEARRHQKELDDLKAAATAANALNTQQYQKAVDDENKLHALKMKNIADQQKAQNASSGSGSNASTSSGSNSDSGSGSGALTSTIVQPVELHVHLDGAVIIGNQVDKAAEQFARPILKQLAAIQQRSRLNILTGGKL